MPAIPHASTSPGVLDALDALDSKMIFHEVFEIIGSFQIFL